MNPLLDKEPVKRAEKSIKEFDPNLKIICLEQTARTAQDAATALGCNVGAIVKSLLFSTGDSFVLCLVSGDQRCSLNKLKKIIDEKDVPMAKPEDVKNVTGSILIWAIIILLPLVSFIEQPWQSIPRIDSLISVIYLGIVPTGVAWLLRFRILKKADAQIKANTVNKI